MKVLLYTEGYKTISKSGLGKAIKHQMKALEDNNIDYTTNLKDDFDVLHVNFYGPKSYLYTKKMRKKGKKIVYHAHSTEEDFRNSFLFSNLVAPLFKKWLCTCYRLGDQIITPTEYSKRLLENYNLNRPIKAISNGVDTEFFERNTKKGEEFRNKYGYSKKDKVIVGIGLYIERKGILDFVELAKRLPEYKFIWFGYSPLWASPIKIKKAVNTKLDNLNFAGYVESEVIKSALSGADLYLFPTLEETEGIPIIEALTSKIPTLIRDIPVFEEYPDKKCVYKAKDIDDFEKKIKLILEGKLPNITEEGYKLAKKKDTKVVGLELIKTYEETLNMDREEEKNPSTTQRFRSLALLVATILLIFGLFLSDKSYYLPFKDKEEKLNDYSYNVNAFDNNISIKVYDVESSIANKTFAEIEQLFKDYDKLTDLSDKNSSLSKLNSSKKKEETIDYNIYQMIKIGNEYKDITNGLININNNDLVNLWNKYLNKKSGKPADKEISKALKNNKDIKLLDDNKIKVDNLNINLDILKKGYALKKTTEMLELVGITKYIITLDNFVVTGSYYNNPGSYNVVINSPFTTSSSPLTSINIANKSLVTKTIYQNYYEYKGKNYNNIINFKTGKCTEELVGVSVISSDPVMADVYSYFLMLLPIEEGKEIVNNNNDIEAIWIYGNEEAGGFIKSDNI